MTSASTRRYAEALADILFSPGTKLAPDEAFQQLTTVEAVLKDNDNLRHVMITPAVPPARKRAVIADLAEPLGLAPLMRNFVFVLIDHHRIAQVAEIREALGEVLDERMGVARADVVSAVPLTKAQSADLEKELGRLTGKQVWARYRTDPSLIGGVTARVASRTYDGSVRGQLENLRQRLAAGG